MATIVRRYSGRSVALFQPLAIGPHPSGQIGANARRQALGFYARIGLTADAYLYKLADVARHGFASLGNNGSSTNSFSAAYTVGSLARSVLVVGIVGDVYTGHDDLISVTYGGAAMSLVQKLTAGSPSRFSYLYVLFNPPAGSNTLTVSATNSHYISVGAVDYYNVVAAVDNSIAILSASAVSSYASTLSTIADRCLVVLFSSGYSASGSDPTAGTNSNFLCRDTTNGTWGLFDSALVTPAAPFSMTAARSNASNKMGAIMLSLAPYGGKTTRGYSFTANAELKKRVAWTFASSAVLSKHSVAGSFHGDAKLLRRSSYSFSADAKLLKTSASSFTSNAILLGIIPGAISGDADLKKTANATFYSDAVLKFTVAGSFSGDAQLKKVFSQTFTANAELKKTVTAAFTAGATVISVIGRLGFIHADAVLQGSVPASFSVDAQLLAVFSNSFTANAVTKKTCSGSFSADAELKRTSTVSLLADAVAKASVPGSFNLDAQLQTVSSGLLTADAVLRERIAASFAADVDLRRTVAASFTASAVMRKSFGGSFTADASFTATRVVSRSFVASAVLKKRIYGSLKADAYVSTSYAAFLGSDGVTEGNWLGVYGLQGYSILLDAQVLPSYLPSFTVTGSTFLSFAASTTDPRALMLHTGSGRRASAWSSGSQFTMALPFSDRSFHKVSLYCVDWTQSGRVETVAVYDTATGVVLASQQISNFGSGVWLSFEVAGNVTIRVTNNSFSSTGVVSGIFFDLYKKRNFAVLTADANLFSVPNAIVGSVSADALLVKYGLQSDKLGLDYRGWPKTDHIRSRHGFWPK